jgi:hypothetical protein
VRPLRNIFYKLSRTEQRREGVAAYLWCLLPLEYQAASSQPRLKSVRALPPQTQRVEGERVIDNSGFGLAEYKGDLLKSLQFGLAPDFTQLATQVLRRRSTSRKKHKNIIFQPITESAQLDIQKNCNLLYMFLLFY